MREIGQRVAHLSGLLEAAQRDFSALSDGEAVGQRHVPVERSPQLAKELGPGGEGEHRVEDPAQRAKRLAPGRVVDEALVDPTRWRREQRIVGEDVVQVVVRVLVDQIVD